MDKENLFELPADMGAEEFFETLLQTKSFRLERIISRGNSTPAGEWYDQDRPEWVVLLKGSAALLIEGQEHPLYLQAGDYVNLPSHLRHRVEWTNPHQETVWLALHHTD